MNNREVFAKDPATLTLLNQGVAAVIDAETPEQLRTLRFELETFVCEGHYDRGLCRILETFLKNLDKPEQPGVWVSGFYGSGKSHLVKILRYLWVDYRFADDGATARGLANLPTPVKDLLKELSTAGKKFGLHAASGTLGAAARGRVRLGLLAIVFRSAGLPAEYYKARFVMWLKAKNLLDAVKAHLEKVQSSLAEELQDMYVSPLLANALLAADKNFAANPAEAKKLLAAEYPRVDDVSLDDMVEAIRKALTVGKRFPSTLLVLDEIQQNIGDSPERASEIQEVVEACSKRFDGKLMVVGTGQSALSGTPLLQRLLGRFPVQIDLLDTDVEAVTRKMVLAKRPDKAPDISTELLRAQGEISRHLAGTQIETRSEDQQVLVADYPLLPVRRRFWERTLRAVDQGGTAAQLRSQLWVVLETVKECAGRPLGTVIPADALFDQKASEMRQSGVLSPDIHETVLKLRQRTPHGLLQSRLCALIFLIGKLPREVGADIGVRANPDALADLMVEDLKVGSNALRSLIPGLLSGLAQEGVLMQIGGEYRMQTPESTAWNKDYEQRYNRLHNDPAWINSKIGEVLSTACHDRLKDAKKPTQGKSKEPRKVELCFSAQALAAAGGDVPVLIRNAWSDSENTVRVEALQAPTDSPVVYVFIPKEADGELKKALAAQQAAQETLDARGRPSTPDGREAQAALETRKRTADSDLDDALQQIFKTTLVLQAGGSSDVGGAEVVEKVKKAAEVAFTRLYPQFGVGDEPRWDSVIDRVRKGDGAPLKVIDHEGNTESHPVCQKVLAFIGTGKKGAEIRSHFGGKGYGWPKDTIDGALLALCAGGHVRCNHQGKTLEVKQIERTKIGQYDFRAETITLNAGQKMALRTLFQDAAAITCKPNEEANAAVGFLESMRKRAASAGGPPPLPSPPDTAYLEEIAGLSGNAQLLALHDRREQLKADAAAWRKNGETVEQRGPRWKDLEKLLRYAAGLPVAAAVQPQVDAILSHRSLLASPDPVPPLCKSLTEALRTALVQSHAEFQTLHQQQILALTAAEAWQRLSNAEQAELLARFDLDNVPDIQTGTESELLACLERLPLDQWATRRDALPQRCQNALTEAARLREPTAVRVTLPSATIKVPADLDAWVAKVREEVLPRLPKGPVLL